jgi:hypothetical protein
MFISTDLFLFSLLAVLFQKKNVGRLHYITSFAYDIYVMRLMYEFKTDDFQL